MMIERISARGVGPGLIGLAVLSLSVATGCAAAETHTVGGSTAVIKQSGGSRPVESQVTRDRDGQTIVTQDGRSTDVTIQRGSAAASSDSDEPLVTPQIERLGQTSSGDGVRSRFPATTGGVDDMQETYGLTQDAFKARMLERMR
jgi:hypothetical protein